MVSLFIIHSHTIVIFPTKKHVPLLSVMQCTVRCFLLQKCNVIVQPEYILTQLKRERERALLSSVCSTKEPLSSQYLTPSLQITCKPNRITLSLSRRTFRPRLRDLAPRHTGPFSPAAFAPTPQVLFPILAYTAGAILPSEY